MLTCKLLVVTHSVAATNYFVRTDGGSASQCTGLVDAAYPGSGVAQACAWNHPFQALPPDAAPRMAGGDTLFIGPGEYRMGYDAPGAEACDAGFPWDCRATPIPAGLSPTQPTRILGQGWDAGCADAPQLWGAERSHRVLDLSGSNNVALACLEITDHAGCVEFHSGAIECERETFPYGDWASVGLYAEDAANVRLTDLDIHGMAHTGVQAGRLQDWDVHRVRIAANGWAGWDGDLPGSDSNSGSMTFRRLTIEWNGCGETYPGLSPTDCWGQVAGGYGDGMGTGFTGGDWLFEDSVFQYNTSDGLDLLYAINDASIVLRRCLARGNAGNAFKTYGPTRIENSIAIGDCGVFDGNPANYFVDHCRAQGNTLSLSLSPGDQVELANNTITGEGDCLLLANCDGACNGGERITVRNNILLGQVDFLQDFEQTCLFYGENFPQGDAVFDIDYALITDVKNNACAGASSQCNTDAGLVDSSLDTFNAELTLTSPAIDAADAGTATADDFNQAPRDASPDIGAIEYSGRLFADGFEGA